MTILFVFFVLPLATILLTIVLQKILRNPILVGITFFAVYLIVAFTAFSANLAAAIIGVIVLSILAFITALIVNLICILRERFCNNNNLLNIHNNYRCNHENNETQTLNTGNLLRISCNCQNGESNDLLTINSNTNCNNNDSDNSNNCGCNNREAIIVNEQINPINTNIRRSCCNRGYYRRF